DIQGMAGRITELLDDFELQGRMSRRAAEMTARFTVERVGERREGLIRLLLSNPKREETQRALARDFMTPIADNDDIVRRNVIEYEKAAVLTARMVRSESHGD